MPPRSTPPAQRRTKQVLFKATVDEKAKYERATEKSTSKDLSSWIRTTLDREAEKIDVHIRPAE